MRIRVRAHVRMQCQMIKNVRPGKDRKLQEDLPLPIYFLTLYGAPFAYLALINTWRMKFHFQSYPVVVIPSLRYDESEALFGC